jgi:hypothetical protein
MNEQLKSHKTVEQIAKKHRLDVSFIANQLKMGVPIEHEHTKNNVMAMDIALQHLDEIPDYYTRLKKMESDAKKHHKKFKDFSEACWKGYTQKGLKKKGNKTVPNCVPTNEETTSGDEGLHDWFNKSKSSDGKKGWVQLGRKHAGKPCARQPGQTSTPKCGSSKMAANLSSEDEERARRRKNRLDPNQPEKTGGAKPTNVRTEEWSDKYKKSINCKDPKGFSQRAHCQGRKKKMNEQSFQIDTSAHKSAQRQQKIRNLASGTNNPNEKAAAQRKLSGPSLPLADEYINEVKDKPGKGSGKKDACYNKVKSRYDVWPSAYASGALVKCRKVGAANWGTKSEAKEDQRYCPLCKKNETKSDCSFGPSLWEKYSIAKVHPANEEKDYEYQMARNELQTAKRAIDKLMNKLKGEGNMEAWVQSKISKAADYLDSVSDYMEGDREEIEESSNVMKYNEYGQTYVIRFTWRGLMYKVQIFIPSLKKPTAQDIKKQLEKIYPGAQLMYFEPKEYDPVDPTILLAKEEVKKYYKPNKSKVLKLSWERRKEANEKAVEDMKSMPGYQSMSAAARKRMEEEIQIQEVAAWQRSEGKNTKGGLNEKGRKSYERENPGSDLKAPSKKVGNPRRASFCARMSGMKKKLTSAKTANDPNSRINKSLRAWNC